MTESAWQTIIQALIAGIVTVILAYFQLKITLAIKAAELSAKIEAQKVATKVEVATVKAEMATATQTAALAAVTEVATKTHSLVNSDFGELLKSSAALARWKATQTGKPEDAQAAETAEKRSAEHEAAQVRVDAEHKKI